MKNYEKYAEEIKEYEGSNFCNEFVTPHILKPNRRCDGTSCDLCHMLQMIWLLEDYKEPEVDWSNVEIDTPILVREGVEDEWEKRHFAKYENGHVYAWDSGKTSWSETAMCVWKYAKLAESEEGGAR